MSRLFDTKRSDEPSSASGVRERAEAFDKAFADDEELDEESRRLSERLKDASAVSPIRYERHRKPGTRWLIEHARVANDYVFQLHPLRPIQVPSSDVIAALIATMDQVYPRSIQIFYRPPNDQLGVNFYTVTAQGAAGVPGWEEASRRALDALSDINVWG